MTKKASKQREYEFTLIVAGLQMEDHAQSDALYEAGCDDATISLREGRGYLTFSRKAESLKDAILSAYADVRSADRKIEILRVDIGSVVVTQSEVASRTGLSRQRIHQYITGARGPGNFPAPAWTFGTQAVWQWADVADWLAQNDIVADQVADEARQVELINNVLGLRQQKKANATLTREIVKAIR